MTAILRAIDGGKSRQEIKTLRLTDKEIASCASSEHPETKIKELAKNVFEEKNGAVQGTAEEQLANLTATASNENEIIGELQRERHRWGAFQLGETPSEHNPLYKISRSETFNKKLYECLRYITLAVSVVVIALYARASGISADISSSWFIALIYAFPAFIASGFIANTIDFTDELVIKRKRARRLAIAALMLLVIWVGATAIMFAPKEASQGAFAVNFGAASPTSTVTSPLSVVAWLFPKGIVGIILLFAHVLTDIMASAALAAHAKLQDLKGRKTVYSEAEEVQRLRQTYDLHKGRTVEVESEIAELKGILKACAASLAATVSDAECRVATLQHMIVAEKEMAQNRAIRDWASGSHALASHR